jgi:hypothetical protein
MLTHTSIFVWAMLGHFVGDYLLQNQWMATQKTWHKGRCWFDGMWPCTIHVTLYTMAVYGFMVGFTLAPGNIYYVNNWLLWLVIFVPHWLIDRFGVAAWFMQLKNGYSPWSVFKPDYDPYGGYNMQLPLPQLVEKGFTPSVYIMNDNTMHFVCLALTTLLIK